MKRIFLLILFAGFLTWNSMAQPNPGQNAGGGNVGGAPIGGSAPIGGGIALLIGLAAAYGSVKVYQMRKNVSEN